MQWETIAEWFIVVYFSVSIILEILALIFYYTPSPEDDKWIARVKGIWNVVRKFFLLVSIRTPLTVLLSVLYTAVLFAIELVKKAFKKS